MKMAITWTSQKRKFAPLLFTGSLEKSMEDASALGYGGMELAIRTSKDVSAGQVNGLAEKYDLEVSMVTTGLARAEDGLSFSDMDERTRRRAVERLKEQIGFAAELKAPVLVGLILGQLDVEEKVRNHQVGWIVECCRECGAHANTYGVRVVVEPINRYETNFLNTIEQSVDFIRRVDLSNVGIMADTFHMNIEERDLSESLEKGAEYLKYVHLVDSNRLAPGFGHLDVKQIIQTLQKIGYDGFLSIECLPEPDSMTAAKQAIEYVTPLIS